MQLHVFTVGHSTHSGDQFVELIRLNGVSAIADVRSSPFSRFAPQFNRDALKARLDAAGIAYVFLGRELGARTTDLSCYDAGRVQYARLAATSSFREGIERVVAGAASARVALLCTEKDPLDCHRTVLIAEELQREGVSVDHILADGTVETHADAMLRLLDRMGVQPDLFVPQSEQIARALAEQAHRIAYVDPTLVEASGLAAS